MRPRSSGSVRYPRRFFARRFGELLEEAQVEPIALSKALGASRQRMSHYLTGRAVPTTRAGVRELAEAIAASSPRSAKAIELELIERRNADLIAAHLDASEMTAAEARRALDRVEAARKKRTGS